MGTYVYVYMHAIAIDDKRGHELDLKEHRETYMGSFGGRKGKEEILNI